MKVGKVLFASFLFFVLLLASCDDSNLPKELICASIQKVAEYGTYFGAKAAKLDDNKAKIIEESFRLAKQVIKNETVNDFLNVDELMAVVPAEAKKYVEEAIVIVNTKYVTLKGKIPADKICYIKAIFDGGFDGVEMYRKSIIKEAEVSSGYEPKLAQEYQKAKNALK